VVIGLQYFVLFQMEGSEIVTQIDGSEIVTLDWRDQQKSWLLNYFAEKGSIFFFLAFPLKYQVSMIISLTNISCYFMCFISIFFW